MRGIITQRQVLDQFGCDCDVLESTYIKYFSSIGIEPLVISNFQKAELFDADLIILTGGGSVKSEYFEIPHCDYVQQERDLLEKELFELAIKNNIPILAICRGFQYVNALLGGKISRLSNLNQDRPVKKDHEVQLKNGIIKVNNFHNDGIFEDKLAKKIFIVAKDSSNGTVEAFYSKELRILGLQWHPEREFNDDNSRQVSTSLVSNFIQNKGELDEGNYFSCG
jgi:putative glutamine amidotransferase